MSDDELAYARHGEGGLSHFMTRPVTGVQSNAVRARRKELADPSTRDTRDTDDRGTYAELQTPNKAMKEQTKLLQSMLKQQQAQTLILCFMCLFLAVVSRALYDDNAQMNKLFKFVEDEMHAFRESGITDSMRRVALMYKEELEPWMRTRMQQAAELEARTDGSISKVDALLDKGMDVATHLGDMLDGGFTIGGTPKHKEGATTDSTGWRGAWVSIQPRPVRLMGQTPSEGE